MKSLIRFDWAMKKLLRDKANFAVLEGFLTELFKFEVTIIQIGESESNQQQSDDKYNRVDILAHTTSNEIILIEMQADSQVDYFHRMLYGASKSIVENIKLGENYEAIKKVYVVNIVYFQLGQGSDYVYHGKTEFKGLHTHDLLQLNESQKERYKVDGVSEIYPEFYILKINEFDGLAKDGLDEWIYFFKNDEVKDEFKAKGLDLVKEKLQISQMSVAEFKAYERYWDNRRNAASTISTAVIEGEFKGEKKGMKKGLKKGMKVGLEKGIKQGLIKGKKEGLKQGKEIGRKEGIEAGRKQGREVGRKEGNVEGHKKAMIEVAKNMLSEGFSAKDIAKVTGLKEGEINLLK